MPEHLDRRSVHLESLDDVQPILVQKYQLAMAALGRSTCTGDDILVIGAEDRIRVGIQRRKVRPCRERLLKRPYIPHCLILVYSLHTNNEKAYVSRCRLPPL
jgi:hypothetical protein